MTGTAWSPRLDIGARGTGRGHGARRDLLSAPVSRRVGAIACAALGRGPGCHSPAALRLHGSADLTSRKELSWPSIFSKKLVCHSTAGGYPGEGPGGPHSQAPIPLRQF